MQLKRGGAQIFKRGKADFGLGRELMRARVQLGINIVVFHPQARFFRSQHRENAESNSNERKQGETTD